MWRQVNLDSDPVQVEAYVLNSDVIAPTSYTVTANSHQSINALVAAISVAVAGSSGIGGAVSGSGVYAANMISTDVKAFQNGSGTAAGIKAGSVGFSATDTSTIHADAVAASLAASLAGDAAVSVAIGLSIASNEIDNDVETYIVNVPAVTSTAGGISLNSQENASINAVSTAASLAVAASDIAVAIAGAGAEATNVILGLDNAYVGESNLTSASTVSIGALDDSQITAEIISVAASVGIAPGAAGLGLAIGVSVAENFIGYDGSGDQSPLQVEGYVDDSGISAQGSYTVTARSDQSINALVLSVSAAVAGSASVGLAAAGSGVYGENEIAVDSQAFQDNGIGSGSLAGVHAASVMFSASDASTIVANVAAAALGIALGGDVGLAVALGVSLASNTIDNEVKAYIADVSAVTTTSGAISVTSAESGNINAVAAAAALSAAGSLGVGVAISGAGAEATNTILGADNAFVSDSTLKSASSVALSSVDTSQINAKIIAASVSLGVGVGAGGAGAAIGVSVARNFIGNDVDTSTTADHLTTDNVLTLNPGDTVKIAGGSRAGDVYQYLGSQPVTVSFDFIAGVSHPAQLLAGQKVLVKAGTDGVTADSVYQYVGNTPLSNPNLATEQYSDASNWHQITALQQDYSDPSLWRQTNVSSSPLQVEAYAVNSGVTAATTYTVTADSAQSINALVLAMSAAVAGGLGVGGAVAGSGVYTGNLISTDVLAYHDGGVSTGAGISASGTNISASDTSTIIANAAAVALSASLSGGLSISISIGLSIAMNSIDNDVEAYIANATHGVTTTGGDAAGVSSVSVSSTENATIQSVSAAASLAVAGSLGVGVAVSGAGADATNVILGKDNAYISGSPVTSAGGVSITTQDLSKIQATIISAAASLGVGIGAGAGAVAIGASVAENFVGYNADGSAGSLQILAYAQNSSISAKNDLTLSATSNQTISADRRGRVRGHLRQRGTRGHRAGGGRGGHLLGKQHRRHGQGLHRRRWHRRDRGEPRDRDGYGRFGDHGRVRVGGGGVLAGPDRRGWRGRRRRHDRQQHHQQRRRELHLERE